MTRRIGFCMYTVCQLLINFSSCREVILAEETSSNDCCRCGEVAIVESREVRLRVNV